VRLRSVNPAEVQVPSIRVTSFMDSETLAEFKNTIRAMGVVEPPICVEVEGKLVLVDGLHRLQEAQEQGLDRIQVAVLPGTMQDVLLLNLVTSFTRGRPRARELVEVIGKLYDEFDMTIEDLRKKTGLSQEYVERLITIYRAGDELLDALDEGRIGTGAAYEIARIPDPEVRSLVLHQQITYGWSVADLRRHIKAVLAAKEEVEK